MSKSNLQFAKQRVRAVGTVIVMLACAFGLLSVLAGPEQALAFGTYLSSTNASNPGFNQVYPASSSGTNASCALCHDTTGGPDIGLNTYGNAFRASSGATTAARFQAIESATSINVNGGTTNLDEIRASTQPGWTTGNNPIFDIGGSSAGSIAALTTIGALDPAGNVNQAPVLTNPNPGNQPATEGQPLTIQFSATDDGPLTALTFSGVNLPTGATLTDNHNGTATFAWTPSFTQGQTTPYPVTISVTDAGGLTASQSFTITVGNVNQPPAFSGPPIGNQPATEGVLLTFQVSATDPDGDTLTFSGSLPTGATLTDNHNGTATFAWTPAAGQASSTPYPVTITVTDPGQLTASQSFTIMVGTGTNVNQPPVLTNPNPGNQPATEGQPLTIPFSATDPEGGTLTFSSLNLPIGATLTAGATNGTATFSWTPAAGQANSTPYSVTITVTDPGGLTASQSFTIMVTVGTGGNRPPVLSPSPVGDRTVTEGELLTIAFNASDPDGDLLTFSSSPLPNGASLVAGATNIATFSWTPATGQASSTPYPVTITVTDPGGLTASQTFTITVLPATPSSTGLDYDIVSFTATSQVTLSSRRAVRLRVTVTNVGTAEGGVSVTLVGLQNGVEVYRRTRQVSAPVGTTVTRRFRSYTPTSVGTIEWTVTIEDLAPAHNTATATTTVVQSQREQEREGEDERSGSEGESSESED